MQCNGKTIWLNLLPKSPIYARPVSLFKAKETRENIAVVNLKELETSQSSTSTGVQFIVRTEVSTVDGQMIG